MSLKWAGGSIPEGGELRPAPSTLLGTVRSNPNLLERTAGAKPEVSQEDLAPRFGLALPDKNLFSLLYDDFNNDYDLDLILFPAKGRPIVWVNDRAGKYRILESSATGFQGEDIVGATSGDPYKTGRRDVLTFAGTTLHLYRNNGDFVFKLDQDWDAQFGRLGGTGGQWADFDNDGDLDLLVADAHRPDGTRGPTLLVNRWPEHRFVDVTELDPGNLLSAIRTHADASCVVADFNSDGRLDVLLAEMNAQPQWIENVTSGGHYIAA